MDIYGYLWFNRSLQHLMVFTTSSLKIKLMDKTGMCVRVLVGDVVSSNPDFSHFSSIRYIDIWRSGMLQTVSPLECLGFSHVRSGEGCWYQIASRKAWPWHRKPHQWCLHLRSRWLFGRFSTIVSSAQIWGASSKKVLVDAYRTWFCRRIVAAACPMNSWVPWMQSDFSRSVWVGIYIFSCIMTSRVHDLNVFSVWTSSAIRCQRSGCCSSVAVTKACFWYAMTLSGCQLRPLTQKAQTSCRGLYCFQYLSIYILYICNI